MAAKNKYKEVWTPQRKRQLEILFYNGGSVIEACHILGIVKQTFYNWYGKYDDFKEVVDFGKVAAESWWIQKGRDNVDNKRFNHALWLLMMVNKFKWHSAYAKREEKKEIINEHIIEVKNAVDVDSILKKAINKGITQLDNSTKQVH
tara:strand:- start:25 stop:465 length:441 start_codon:yes stop_codon:yes gene_type:complete